MPKKRPAGWRPRLGFDEEEVLKISMAVREAAVNAVLHGNAYDPNKKVSLAFERTANDLSLRFVTRARDWTPARSPIRWLRKIC